MSIDAPEGTVADFSAAPQHSRKPDPQTPPISARIGGIAESATLAVDAKAKALKAAGRPVIGFGAGEPDFPTPDYIVAAAAAACCGPGEPPVHPRRRAARAAQGGRRQDAPRLRLRRSPPDQVLITNGGKQAVYQAFATLLDPGDEVLLPAPYWTTYPEAIALAGGVSVPVVADEKADYLVTIDQLEAGADPAHQGAAVLLAVQPDRCGRTRRSRSRRSAAGPPTTASG